MDTKTGVMGTTLDAVFSPVNIYLNADIRRCVSPMEYQWIHSQIANIQAHEDIYNYGDEVLEAASDQLLSWEDYTP